MSDIDTDIAQAAVIAITKLSKHATRQQKEHFTQALTILAQCYGDDAKYRGVLIMSNDEEMATLSINADPWETAGLVHLCYDQLNLKAFQKMPEHYHAH